MVNIFIGVKAIIKSFWHYSH